MNILNHFLAAFLALYLISLSNSLTEVILFSIIFGIGMDLGQGFSILNKKSKNHLRTWIEEPFALIIIALPIGLLLSLIKQEYLLMTIVPYVIHAGMDYLTLHEVSPFAPFNKKTIKVGFFKSFPTPNWYSKKQKGISENYVTLALIILFLFIMFI